MGISNRHSEYPLKTWQPLEAHFELISDTDAVFVEGIGSIAQYHCYCDMLYSHGVIYFLRDWLIKDIDAKIASRAPFSEMQPLYQRLDTLNSKIRVHEQSQCQ